MLNHGATKSRLGLLRNHVGANEVLRYCEICVKEEIQNYGFPFWNRACACPWVYFCPLHKQLLSEVDYHSLHYKDRALILPGSGEMIKSGFNEAAAQKLIKLSEQTVEIMQCKNLSVYSENIYHNLLVDIGLATNGRSIKQTQITKMVRDWLTQFREIAPFDRLFELLNVERSWASTIAGDEKGFHHPIKHLILLNSLDLELRDLSLSNFGGAQLDLALSKKNTQISSSEIRNAIKNEGTITKAAKKLGVCVTTLCTQANRLGIQYTHRPKTVSDEVKSEVLRLLREGKSSSESASLLNISVSTVNRIKRSLS